MRLSIFLYINMSISLIYIVIKYVYLAYYIFISWKYNFYLEIVGGYYKNFIYQ